MDEALKQLGIPSLRPWQARVLENWRSGRDALVLSGTGTGKSLCFQLPPIITGQYWFVRGANRADFRAHRACHSFRSSRHHHLASNQPDA